MFALEDEPFVMGEILQRLNRTMDVGRGKLVLPPLEPDPVEPTKLFLQDTFEEDVGDFSAPLQVDLLRAQIGIAQVLQKLQRRDLRKVVFEEGGRGHC